MAIRYFDLFFKYLCHILILTFNFLILNVYILITQVLYFCIFFPLDEMVKYDLVLEKTWIDHCEN